MRRITLLAVTLLANCAVSSEFGKNNNPFGDAGASGDSGNGFGSGDGGGNNNGTAPLIYAHSDTELFSMDPTTQAITDIGPFEDGTSKTPVITDLAVNAEGDVWVNSETAIYRATIPNGAGPVSLTHVADIAVKASQVFYALAFTPTGVLGSGETLVAGDNVGALYAVETNGQTTNLGSFGADSKGNPYELSGDIVFYMQNGSARGLATVRSCQKGGSCSTSNDLLAEIDVPAMQAAYQSKAPASTLKKQFLGSGTGYGRLFGVGAWDNSVFAFSRSSGTTPAELIIITGTGAGTVAKSFGQISSGWSGAGVTTKATVTILPN